MEPLARFLSETFPEIEHKDYAEVCWVAKAIRNERPELSTLDDAIQVVAKYGQLEQLRVRVGREHPLDSEHNCQYDWRVKDCLTEACGFAWAVLRELGSPKFCDAEGSPDIRLDTGNWVEVKAIHSSVEEQQRMARMLEGEVISGAAKLPADGFYKKFCDSFLKATQQLDNHECPEGLDKFVFFNLTGLDTPQWVLGYSEPTIWVTLTALAEKMEELKSNVKVVMCYNYNWKNPFRDPYREA